MTDLLNDLIIALLGGLVGGLLTFPLARHQERLTAHRDLNRFGVKLAALAIRAREEVVSQLVTVTAGPWITDALARQKYLLDD